MNPWLITWKVVGEHHRIPDNLIAAILPNRTSYKDVRRIMYLLYHSYGGYISDQLCFAKRQYGHKICHTPMVKKYRLGSNPCLHAQQVFNFQLRYEDDGDEVATWNEHNFDPIEMQQIASDESRYDLPSFVWVRKCTYRKSMCRIEREERVRGEIPRNRIRTSST
jgi:hypothetical protein